MGCGGGEWGERSEESTNFDKYEAVSLDLKAYVDMIYIWWRKIDQAFGNHINDKKPGILFLRRWKKFELDLVFNIVKLKKIE